MNFIPAQAENVAQTSFPFRVPRTDNCFWAIEWTLYLGALDRSLVREGVRNTPIGRRAFSFPRAERRSRRVTDSTTRVAAAAGAPRWILLSRKNKTVVSLSSNLRDSTIFPFLPLLFYWNSRKRAKRIPDSGISIFDVSRTRIYRTDKN